MHASAPLNPPLVPLAGDPVQALAALVVKDGIGIGGLAEPSRAMLLGMVWAGLPCFTMSESQVNQLLRAQLGGAVRCLATDHVELRRWLCDSGWLQRDGFGREYRRVSPAGLPAPLQALARALKAAFDEGGTDSWVDGLRAARDALRAARRQAHARSSQGSGAAAP